MKSSFAEIENYLKSTYQIVKSYLTNVLELFNKFDILGLLMLYEGQFQSHKYRVMNLKEKLQKILSNGENAKHTFKEYIYNNYREAIKACSDEEWVPEIANDQFCKDLFYKFKIRYMSEIIARLERRLDREEM